jgi:hypothetical protein
MPKVGEAPMTPGAPMTLGEPGAMPNVPGDVPIAPGAVPTTPGLAPIAPPGPGAVLPAVWAKPGVDSATRNAAATRVTDCERIAKSPLE